MPQSYADTKWPSDRRRNADAKPNRKQHQHFAHHHPDHGPRPGTKRMTDPELFLAAGDNEGHHPVEADRGEDSGEKSQPGGQDRSSPPRASS